MYKDERGMVVGESRRGRGMILRRYKELWNLREFRDGRGRRGRRGNLGWLWATARSTLQLGSGRQRYNFNVVHAPKAPFLASKFDYFVGIMEGYYGGVLYSMGRGRGYKRGRGIRGVGVIVSFEK